MLVILDSVLYLLYNPFMKKISGQVNNAFIEIGMHIKTWRLVYQLKAAQVAERAGISVRTLQKIESGDPSIGTAAFLEVARSLGLLETLIDSLNPLNNDLGRARINDNLPKRIK